MIRLAKPNDFKNFECLYNDYNCEILYGYSQNENVEIDNELITQLEEELKISKEDFCHILCDRHQLIYMIENDCETIGFVWLFQIKKNRWKLYSFSILPSYQDTETIMNIITFLRTLVKEIDICSTSIDVCNILKDIGASSLSKFYYRISQPK